MIKVLEIKETLADSELIEDIYKVEKLNKDIIKQLEANNELDIADFRFMSLIFRRTEIALQKVYTLLKVGGEQK